MERIDERSDCAVSRVRLGAGIDAPVNVELIVQVATHGLGVDEELERDMAAMTCMEKQMASAKKRRSLSPPYIGKKKKR
jgi:hypothetical protein